MQPNSTKTKTYIRFFQASPLSLSLDLYKENQLLFKDLLYEDFSTYINLPSATYTFHITEHNKKEIIYEKKLSLLTGAIYTLILAPKYNGSGALNLFLIEDSIRPTTPHHCFIRIGHFYKPIAHIDVTCLDEGPHFKNFLYAQLSQYIPCIPKNYTVSFKDHTLKTSFLESPKSTFKIGRFYTIYLIGNESSSFSPKAIVSIDGNSYLSS